MSRIVRMPEISQRLGLGRAAVYKLLASGQLKSIRVGPAEKRYLVTESDLCVYLAKQMAKSKLRSPHEAGV